MTKVQTVWRLAPTKRGTLRDVDNSVSERDSGHIFNFGHVRSIEQIGALFRSAQTQHAHECSAIPYCQRTPKADVFLISLFILSHSPALRLFYTSNAYCSCGLNVLPLSHHDRHVLCGKRGKRREKVEYAPGRVSSRWATHQTGTRTIDADPLHLVVSVLVVLCGDGKRKHRQHGLAGRVLCGDRRSIEGIPRHRPPALQRC